MLRLSVSAECEQRRRVLAALTAMPVNEEQGDAYLREIVLPCDVLDEGLAEILVPIYVKLVSLGVHEVEVGIDPGTRCGIVVAAGERIVGAYTVPSELLPRLLSVLSNHFGVRIYLGSAAPREILPSSVADVVLVDERQLPLVKHEGLRLNRHALDALRILVKGRLQAASAALNEAARTRGAEHLPRM